MKVILSLDDASDVCETKLGVQNYLYLLFLTLSVRQFDQASSFHGISNQPEDLNKRRAERFEKLRNFLETRIF